MQNYLRVYFFHLLRSITFPATSFLGPFFIFGRPNTTGPGDEVAFPAFPVFKDIHFGFSRMSGSAFQTAS